MIRLSLNRDPKWVDLLPGLRVLVEPAHTAVLASARSDPSLPQKGEDVTDQDLAIAFGKAVARRVITAWEGVEGEDGKAAPVTPAYIDALLDHFEVYNAWQTKVMAGWLKLDAEKKDSAPSASTTSEGARNTAGRVSKSKASGAKPARKPSTRRKA